MKCVKLVLYKLANRLQAITNPALLRTCRHLVVVRGPDREQRVTVVELCGLRGLQMSSSDSVPVLFRREKNERHLKLSRRWDPPTYHHIIGTMVSFRLAAFLTALTVASAERFNEIKVSVQSRAWHVSCRATRILEFCFMMFVSPVPNV